MTKLFEPLRIGGLDLPNRIVIAPMCQYSAEDGRATSWHTIHLGHLALSGAGLLIIEATSVSPEGRISPKDLGLWSDETQTALAEVIRTVRQNSAIPIMIQLAHAGRKASTLPPWQGGRQIPAGQDDGWRCIAPSPLAFSPTDEVPEALDRAGLERIKQAFVAAAQRTVAIGLDGIELHAAHGYLLHQFLSPLSNRREDEYGGSLDNRMRLLLEVFEAVQAAVPPQFPIFVRISATDWAEGGWDLEQSIVLARALKARGCRVLHVSSAGLTPAQKIDVGPNYQVRFAEAIKRETGLLTIAVGLITEAEQAETILQTGQADMIALARAILYDPRWPWHAAAKLGEQIAVPKQYLRSQPREVKALFRNAAN
jgi:2,4-dienoyl-CoA reductase-like NADH-dependent reductase (Old Yellow Enzyme family)